MKKIVSLFIVLFVFATMASGVAGQVGSGSRLLLTWQANSFIPVAYTGKAIPNQDSDITISLQLLEDGRALSVAKLNVKWYVNSQLVADGVGLSELLISGEDFSASKYSVTAIVRDAKGEIISQKIDVPVTEPLMVVDAPYLNGVVGHKDVYLGAVPFFFNITHAEQVRFSWEINDNLVAVRAQSIIFDIENSKKVRILPVLIKASDKDNNLISSKKIILQPN